MTSGIYSCDPERLEVFHAVIKGGSCDGQHCCAIRIERANEEPLIWLLHPDIANSLLRTLKVWKREVKENKNEPGKTIQPDEEGD